MDLNFENVKKVIVAALIMCLAACAGNTRISKSIKDPDYKNKIDDVLVIFDLTHLEKAQAIENPTSAKKQVWALATELRPFMSIKLSAKNIKSEILFIDNSTIVPFVSRKIGDSTSSILLIDFSSFRTRNGHWDSHMDLRARLFSGKSGWRDLSKEKAVWVAEADGIKFFRAAFTEMTDATIANTIVSAIINGLQADGLIE